MPEGQGHFGLLLPSAAPSPRLGRPRRMLSATALSVLLHAAILAAVLLGLERRQRVVEASDTPATVELVMSPPGNAESDSPATAPPHPAHADLTPQAKPRRRADSQPQSTSQPQPKPTPRLEPRPVVATAPGPVVAPSQPSTTPAAAEPASQAAAAPAAEPASPAAAAPAAEPASPVAAAPAMPVVAPPTPPVASEAAPPSPTNAAVALPPPAPPATPTLPAPPAAVPAADAPTPVPTEQKSPGPAPAPSSAPHETASRARMPATQGGAPQAAPATAEPPAAEPPGAAAAQFSFGGIASDTNALVTGSLMVPPGVDPTYRNRKPSYPLEAARRGEQGPVVLEVHVSPEGLVDDVAIAQSSGFRLLDRSAQETVLTWHFLPAVKNGRPIPFTMPLRIMFSLD